MDDDPEAGDEPLTKGVARWRDGPMRARAHTLVRAGLLAAIYYATARAGLLMDAVSGFATLVWPPTGISLAALVVYGYGLWPGVALGAFLANVAAGAPVPVALGIAGGNTLEALLGTYLLRSIPGFDHSLERLRDVLGLLAFAVVVSTAVSATIGVLSLWAGGVVPSAATLETWRAWWLGDAIGDLTIAPLLLVWTARVPRVRSVARAIEAVALALGLLLVAVLIYGEWSTFDTTLFFPVLLWAALRFGQPGVVTATFVTAVVAVYGTVVGHGPYAGVPLINRLSRLQSFMAVSAPAFLVLGAVMSERAAALTRARQAVAARDEFLSMASHELRTPLTALVLQLAGLQGKLQKTPTDPLARSLSPSVDKAVKVTDRLTTLVETLLDVSRVAATRMQLQPETCDLAEIVRELTERMSVTAAQAHCDLRCRVEGPIGGVWDRLRLEQVLENLLSNAFKYAPGGPVSVDLSATPTTATIRVQDSGRGISPADVDRIFGLFERAAPARHYGGLGLGLYIVRQVVDAHGGTIRVGNVEGGGASFVVELPRGIDPTPGDVGG